MDFAKYPGYKDFVWAIKLNRFGLRFIGLWPETDETTGSNVASDLRVLLVFVLVMIVCGVPLVCGLVQVWGDMILIIDNLQITLPLIVVMMKLLVMRRKRKMFVPIVKMMAEDWTAPMTNADRNLMLRRARLGRLIVICGYVLMVFAFFIIIVLPCFGLSVRHLTNLTDRDRPLPLQTYYFYDTDSSPQFELTFATQATMTFLAAIAYTSVDAFIGLTVLHICGQLENFRDRLAKLDSKEHFDDALRRIVETHLRLIRFADMIEEMFNSMMLGLVFYFGIVFCLYGFLFLTVMTDEGDISLSRLCYALIGVVNLFVHTFLYCGAGEIITEQCEAVYRTIYELNWYELEPRKARCLIILMIRANEPFRITAGRVVPLTMTTFCSLLRTSAGYISFLLAKRSQTARI